MTDSGIKLNHRSLVDIFKPGCDKPIRIWKQENCSDHDAASQLADDLVDLQEAGLLTTDEVIEVAGKMHQIALEAADRRTSEKFNFPKGPPTPPRAEGDEWKDGLSDLPDGA